MNWRDPHTDLVHIVNYSEESSIEWSVRARAEGGGHWMRCGHEVRVGREGHVEPSKQRPVIYMPFLYTQDMPTCLACIVWAPDPVLEAYARQAGYVTGDDEDDQDSLDLDGKA